MGDIDIIVLNSHGVGQYAYCDDLPRWGETLAVKNWRIAKDGGKGSNVACALGNLGVKTAYIGKVGYDPWGDLGEKWMLEAGVDTKYLYRDSEISTGTGLVLIGTDGRNMIIDGEGSGVALKFEEVTNAIDDMSEAKYFISGFEIPYKISLKSCSYAKQKGMITALNPSPISNIELGELDYIDYLFLNEIEAKKLLGKNDKTMTNKEILKSLNLKYRRSTIIVTLGERGCSCINAKGEIVEVCGVKVNKVKNTAGAGDGFMAAVLYKLLDGYDIRNRLTGRHIIRLYQ